MSERRKPFRDLATTFARNKKINLPHIGKSLLNKGIPREVIEIYMLKR
jgi:hypothetical protein